MFRSSFCWQIFRIRQLLYTLVALLYLHALVVQTFCSLMNEGNIFWVFNFAFFIQIAKIKKKTQKQKFILLQYWNKSLCRIFKKPTWMNFKHLKEADCCKFRRDQWSIITSMVLNFKINLLFLDEGLNMTSCNYSPMCFNGSQLAKLKKSIPLMLLPWNL